MALSDDNSRRFSGKIILGLLNKAQRGVRRRGADRWRARIRRRAGLPGDIEFAAQPRQRIPQTAGHVKLKRCSNPSWRTTSAPQDMIIRIRRLRERTYPA